MTRPTCSNTPRIIEAARSGAWTPDLWAHVDRCGECRDTAAIAGALADLAAEAIATSPLAPPARSVWLTAAYRSRLRRQAGVETVQNACAGAIGLVVAAVLAMAGSESLASLLSGGVPLVAVLGGFASLWILGEEGGA
jgi:hypothetical protein